VIVRENEPVTLIGGGDASRNCVDRAIAAAPILVAADSGADQALSYGYEPTILIGDFDSVSTEALSQIPQDRQHRIAEQDSTDFEKCLREIHAPLVVGVGFTGARADHQLAVFNTLVRFPQKRCILLGVHEIMFLCPPTLRLDMQERDVVSLFPFGAVEGVSEGLKWPLNGLFCTPDGKISTSNQATGPIEISVTAPKMLVILPNVYLERVIEAFLSSASVWPGV
jgi:thiamine pyrophosphokinase